MPPTKSKPDPAELMPERRHLDGCPIRVERIEAYVADRPAKRDSDGTVVKPSAKIAMLHCVECGATMEAPEEHQDDLLDAAGVPKYARGPRTAA